MFLQCSKYVHISTGNSFLDISLRNFSTESCEITFKSVELIGHRDIHIFKVRVISSSNFCNITFHHVLVKRSCTIFQLGDLCKCLLYGNRIIRQLCSLLQHLKRNIGSIVLDRTAKIFDVTYNLNLRIYTDFLSGIRFSAIYLEGFGLVIGTFSLRIGNPESLVTKARVLFLNV